MNEQERTLMKRLQRTRRDETICLNWWEVEILLNMIDELRKGKNNEQTDTGRNHEGSC
jgi:hypothetical protein